MFPAASIPAKILPGLLFLMVPHPPRGTRPYSEGGSTDSLCSFLQWRLPTSSRNLQATQFFLQKSSFEFIAGGQLAVSLHLS